MSDRVQDQPIDRREAVKAGATLVASGMVWPQSIASASEPQRPLGVALVGLGSLSTNQIAPALQKTKFCRLAAIVTGAPAKAARWRAKYGLAERSVYTYDTMARMADNADIDIVYVVTPNALHGAHTIAAANAGKHVLCEKPMEVTTARCQAMIDACAKANRQLAIAYRCRHELHHKEVERLARSNTFGATKIIEAGFGFAIGDPTQWRLDHALSGGGPLMDVGIYALQSARMFTGEEPVQVSALTTTTDPVKFKSVEESMTFQLKFPSGVVADCRTSYRVNGMNRVTVYAERGAFGMEPAYNYDGNRGWRSDRAPLQFPPVDNFTLQLDDFAQHIINGTKTSVPGEEGLRDVRILMAIYEAARTGRTITLTAD